jgi:hypothetical protein
VRNAIRPGFDLDEDQAGGSPTPKDVKNADRSEEVYENKGHDDIMSDKKSDFVSEDAGISRNFAGLS